MARIFDNIDLKFTQGLQDIITNTGVKRVDFCVGYFNLRGWDLIIDQIDTLPGDFIEEDAFNTSVHRVCRLLIGMHQTPDELIRSIYTQDGGLIDSIDVSSQKIKIAREFRRQLQIGKPTKQQEITIRRLSQQLKDGKVTVKLYLREPLHAKLYLAYRPDDNFNKIMALMGSSNLTYSGLRGNGELNAEFADCDQSGKLANWFCDRWDDKCSIDITQELIRVLDESWAGQKVIPPYYIYLKAAYHLSEDARNGMAEFDLTPEFRRELFDFQQTAVKIASRHLRNDKRGGAMIGDVVGLGKTITACAIAKIYETTYASSTLVICPANLQEMWQKYAKKYDLKVDIISMAKPIDVDNARYYRLIIIDESHNLRNGAKGTRYRNIKALIDHQDSNVLLLTATPYNKDFSDLVNQLRLFIPDDRDLGIRPEAYIRQLGGEREFLQTHNEIFIRSVAAFAKSDCVEDWNELMKLFLVRRTRTFIKENYAKTDAENGRKYLEFPNGDKSYFPDRLPKAEKFETVHGDQYSRLYSEKMIEMMESLDLPR
ncbi:MAG: helicase, partial [Muribaculaceae bacterium]|nr:helicase [Muribaculaceae bacterium]